MLTAEYAVPPPRARLSLPESRLAAALISDAFMLLGGSPLGGREWGERRTRDVRQAREWLLDTQSEAPMSLQWCCWVISVATGRDVDPEAIADACRRGVVLSPYHSQRQGTCGRRPVV